MFTMIITLSSNFFFRCCNFPKMILTINVKRIQSVRSVKKPTGRKIQIAMPGNMTLEQMRRAQIIDAALRIISEVGVQSVIMDDIAERAGLSKGGIAHYFLSKDALIKESFQAFFALIFQRSRDTMEQYEEPMDQVLSFMWLYNWDDPDVGIGYPLLYDCIALAARNREYQEMFRDWVNNWIALISKALGRGVERGVFSIEDIDGTARVISSIYQGIAMRWFIVKEDHPTVWAVGYCTKAIKQLLLNT